MKKLILAVTVMTLILTSAPVFSVSSSADDINFSESVRLREQLGFNTESSEVRSINSNSKYQETKQIYGIALNDEEVAEMKIRDTLLLEASDLKKLIYNESEEAYALTTKDINVELKDFFAGLYLDNKDNGKIKIGIVGLEQNNRLAEQIKKAFTLPDRIEFFNANINEKELLSIQDEITPLFEDFPITDSSVSLEDNKIIIGVRDLSYVEAIRNRLSASSKAYVDYIYNDNIPTPFNTRTNYSTYLRGGLGIDRPDGNVTYVCSSAFNARKQQSNGTYLYYLITAAHCGQLYSSWNQGGSYMGAAAYRNYGGQSDILAIQIPSNRASAQIQNTDTDFVNIMSYELDHVVGTYVCVAGRNNASPTCGTIVDSAYSTAYSDGMTFTNVVKVDNNQTSGGDSGGAVYARIPNEPAEKRRIYGVLSGGVTNDWYFYSKAGRVFSDLSMTQILTANVSFP